LIALALEARALGNFQTKEKLTMQNLNPAGAWLDDDAAKKLAETVARQGQLADPENAPLATRVDVLQRELALTVRNVLSLARSVERAVEHIDRINKLQMELAEHVLQNH
jgi:hypothetical protein